MMDWRLVLVLGGLGLLVGIAAVAGVTSPATEPLAWSLAAVAWIVVVRRRQSKAQFQHLLMTGLTAGFLAAAAQAIWLATYLHNQPVAALQYAALPDGFPVRAFVLLSGVIKGALFGAIVGVVAVVVDRLTGRPRPRMQDATTE